MNEQELKKLAEEYAAAKGDSKKQSAIFEKIKAGFESLKEKAKAAGAKPFGGAFDIFSEASTIYEAEKESIKNTGLLLEELSGPGGLFSKFSQIGEEGVGLFGRIDEGVKGAAQLAKNMKGLFAVFDDVESLSKTATVLNELGVSFGTLGDVLDSAVLGFGMSGKAAEELTRSIAGIGEATGVGMQTAMENFSAAQKSMAYDSNTLMENFKSLQLTAGQTGVSFNKLTSAFGESMDEFGGSARKAGSLNAILGRSVFNSIDLLGKTEAQRVETIVEGIRNSVDVKALGRNKFQLKAVADGLGLTPDETRRLLTGQMSVDEALAGKESTNPRERANAKMADLLQKRVNPSLAQFEYTIRRTRRGVENLFNSTNKLQRDLVRGLGERLIDMNKFSEILPSARPADLAKTLDNMLNTLTVGQVKKAVESSGIGLSIDQIKSGKIFDPQVLKKEGGEAFIKFFTAIKDTAAQAGRTPAGVVSEADAQKFGKPGETIFSRETLATFSEATSGEAVGEAFKALVDGVKDLKDLIDKMGIKALLDRK
tara:strand:+ start:2412 stop:4031 length:1620 start_codon:yes stop_codon:yes gene_type:complete